MSPSQLRALAPGGTLAHRSDDAVSVRSEAPLVSGSAGLFAAIALANKHAAKEQAGQARPADSCPPAAAAGAPSGKPASPDGRDPRGTGASAPHSRVPSTALFDGSNAPSGAASVTGTAELPGDEDAPSDEAQALVEGWLLLAQGATTAAAAGDAELLQGAALADAADDEASYRLALCPGTCSQLHRVYAALFRGPTALPDCPVRGGDYMVIWRTQAEAQADMAVNARHAAEAEAAAARGQHADFALAFPSAADVRPLSDCVRMLPGLSDSDLHVCVDTRDGASTGFLDEAFTEDGKPQVQLTGSASALLQPTLCWRMAFRAPAYAGLGAGLGGEHGPGLGHLPEGVAVVGCTDSSDWLAWVGCLSALTGTDISSWGDEA